ncbi:hypothetical protein [Pseudotenacibaculum haliotis]|uniref:Uncharacterized protein n=1 Tax=Pseudotenacibaculum haliotis TaxID=1862138 RepID=A0ABW5LSX3_9FLAO
MKNYILKLGVLFLGISLVYSCEPGIAINDNSTSDFGYTLYVDSLANKNAPSLQSFVHAVNGEEWLLFAGRTNQSEDNGGLHDMTGNYTDTSFPPPSYNDSIFVYNVSTDTRTAISLDDMKATLKSKYPNNYKAIQGFESVFRNSNPLVRQDGDYLYVVGGYGPQNFQKTAAKGYNFISYDHVGKIHVPSLVNLVKGDYANVDASKLFSFGRNKQLAVTGAELLKVGINFYAVTGHCFGNNCSGFQKYQDAAYPFTISKDTLHQLTISLGNPITDVIDPTATIADDLSNFRRRDQPIVPAIYKSPANQKIQEGIAIYAGVFKAGNDNNLQAWNDAIYIHPSWANNEGRLFTQDKAYNQNNYNVYACPSFVLYDSASDISHTYLLGGIGDGKFSENGFLSGFTNTAVRIETNIGQYPISSSHELIQPDNLFNKSSQNKAPFYGAEAILFANSSLPLTKAWYTDANGKWQQEETEIIDLANAGDGDIVIGHVYGGIEAFHANPATFGPRKSRASNVIFKVILKKN